LESYHDTYRKGMKTPSDHEIVTLTRPLPHQHVNIPDFQRLQRGIGEIW
jgi:hypothetical protein